MSKKKADAKEAAPVVEEKQEMSKYEFGLSFDISGRGFKMMNEGYVMCEEIFQLLFERFDEEMMKKRVDAEYKAYTVRNAI